MSTICNVDIGLLSFRPVHQPKRVVLPEGQEVPGVGYHQRLRRTHDNCVTLPDPCATGILRVQMDVLPPSVDEYRIVRTIMPDVSQVCTEASNQTSYRVLTLF